jgi:hypothetical protein
MLRNRGIVMPHHRTTSAKALGMKKNRDSSELAARIAAAASQPAGRSSAPAPARSKAKKIKPSEPDTVPITLRPSSTLLSKFVLKASERTREVASYAMLLISMIRSAQASPQADTLPVPKWWASRTPPRPSTQRAINQLRGEVWKRALGLTNFSDLLVSTPPVTSPEKFLPHLPSALLYASN